MLSILLAFSVNIKAEPNWFAGKITRLYASNGGVLVIRGSWRNEYATICSLEGEWKGVKVDTCKGWLSVATTAQISKSNVIVFYADVASCETIPAYDTAPSPSYVMLSD